MHPFVAAVATVAATVLAAGCVPLSPQFELHGSVPPPSDREAFESALFQTVGAHLLRGHRWRIEDSGHVFDALVDDIARARVSVNIDVYIWHSGQPSDRLIEALQKRDKGVPCRIVVDALGSPDFEKNVQPRLRATGCQTQLFRPLLQHPVPERNHRKIVVIDGRIGFVGGFGVRKEWVKASGSNDPEWRDINLRVEGPVAADLQRAFAQNWQEAGGTLLPVEDFPKIEPDGDARVAFVASTFGYVTLADRLTLVTIASAKKRLWLWNAYFVPDAHLRELLIAKARQGVDVRVIAPGDKNDVTASKLGQRHGYPPLLAAGIRVFEYQPTMMHAKTMIVDDRVAVVGSINLDSLSLTRLEEDAIVVEDPELVAALARDWDADVAQSREVREVGEVRDVRDVREGK
ncbi:MAG: cls1 [bacterium]|nr:cls1 [bacterium]